MGTPDFAVPSLKALMEHGDNVQAVVTQPDRPRGRGRKMVPSPVKQAAAGYGLEVLQPENASDRQFCEIIRGDSHADGRGSRHRTDSFAIGSAHT